MKDIVIPGRELSASGLYSEELLKIYDNNHINSTLDLKQSRLCVSIDSYAKVQEFLVHDSEVWQYSLKILHATWWAIKTSKSYSTRALSS